MQLFAQTGIFTESPDASAVVQVVSKFNNTGVLIPRLTTAQMNAISNPTHSLLIFNTDKNKFMYNAGTKTNTVWTFVGDVPAVENIIGTTGVVGDVRYDKATNAVYYWKVSANSWQKLQSTQAAP